MMTTHKLSGGYPINPQVFNMAKCSNCIVGLIGSTRIYKSNFKDLTEDFDKRIEEWNVKTRRHALAHPGYLWKFKYCIECGHRITVWESDKS